MRRGLVEVERRLVDVEALDWWRLRRGLVEVETWAGGGCEEAGGG